MADRFMPRLRAFAWPIEGRGYRAARRIAFRAWGLAFRLRVQLLDV